MINEIKLKLLEGIIYHVECKISTEKMINKWLSSKRYKADDIFSAKNELKDDLNHINFNHKATDLPDLLILRELYQ